jgi:hypothetical protein
VYLIISESEAMPNDLVCRNSMIQRPTSLFGKSDV